MSDQSPEAKHENPATTRQTYAIFCLGGGDVRDLNMTYQEASDLIVKLQAAKGPRKAAKPKVSPYVAILEKATEAANKAGDEWMEKAKARGPAWAVVDKGRVVDTMLDVCGIVYIQITDKRTKFAKWCKSQDKNGYNHSVRVPHKYRMRQEMGLLEACDRAAIAVMRENGIEGISLYNRID